MTDHKVGEADYGRQQEIGTIAFIMKQNRGLQVPKDQTCASQEESMKERRSKGSPYPSAWEEARPNPSAPPCSHRHPHLRAGRGDSGTCGKGSLSWAGRLSQTLQWWQDFHFEATWHWSLVERTCPQSRWGCWALPAPQGCLGAQSPLEELGTCNRNQLPCSG